jgi:hypothetical protein
VRCLTSKASVNAVRNRLSVQYFPTKRIARIAAQS